MPPSRHTLTRPRFSVSVSTVTFVMVLIVSITPITLSILSTFAVDEMIDKYVMSWQASTAQEAAESLALATFSRLSLDSTGLRNTVFDAMQRTETVNRRYCEDVVAAAAIRALQDAAPIEVLSAFNASFGAFFEDELRPLGKRLENDERTRQGDANTTPVATNCLLVFPDGLLGNDTSSSSAPWLSYVEQTVAHQCLLRRTLCDSTCSSSHPQPQTGETGEVVSTADDSLLPAAVMGLFDLIDTALLINDDEGNSDSSFDASATTDKIRAALSEYTTTMIMNWLRSSPHTHLVETSGANSSSSSNHYTYYQRFTTALMRALARASHHYRNDSNAKFATPTVRIDPENTDEEELAVFYENKFFLDPLLYSISFESHSTFDGQVVDELSSPRLPSRPAWQPFGGRCGAAIAAMGTAGTSALDPLPNCSDFSAQVVAEEEQGFVAVESSDSVLYDVGALSPSAVQGLLATKIGPSSKQTSPSTLIASVRSADLIVNTTAGSAATEEFTVLVLASLVFPVASASAQINVSAIGYVTTSAAQDKCTAAGEEAFENATAAAMRETAEWRTATALRANYLLNITHIAASALRRHIAAASVSIYDGDTGTVLYCTRNTGSPDAAGVGNFRRQLSKLNNFVGIGGSGSGSEEDKEAEGGGEGGAGLGLCHPTDIYLSSHNETLRRHAASGKQDMIEQFHYLGDAYIVTVVQMPLPPNIDPRHRPNWYLIHAYETSFYLNPLFISRGKIVVTALALGALSIIMMLLMMRSLVFPLKALSNAVACCARMDLEAIETMEESTVSEIAEIQRSVSYLVVRLYHYIRFLPDRVVLRSLGEEGAAELQRGSPRWFDDGARAARRIGVLNTLDDSDSADSNDSAHFDSARVHEQEEKWRREEHRERVRRHLGGDDDAAAFLQEDDSSSNGDDDNAGWVLVNSRDQSSSSFSPAEPPLQQQQHRAGATSEEAPLHLVYIDLLYESRHAARNNNNNTNNARKDMPHKNARVLFHYRATDPVHSNLLRACRSALKERPGEVLVMFVSTPDGKRQLSTDEDVLFAIEFFATHGEVAQLDVTVRKGAQHSLFPVVIAAATVLNLLARALLAGERMTHSDSRVQLLGVLLVACASMQIVQNIIIARYLVKRFAKLSDEFRSWLAISDRECYAGVFFAAFSVTNLEVMACHLRLCSNFRLNAPLDSGLTNKIRKYTLMGFIVGDLVPFVMIAIETVLRKRNQDAFAAIALFFSVASVTCIMIRHGTIRFVMDVAVARNKSIRSANTKTLLLSRKDVTVMSVKVGGDELLASLGLDQFDHFSAALYRSVAAAVQRYGGMITNSQGCTIHAAFNAHSVVPHNGRAALDCFLSVARELERTTLPNFCDNHNVLMNAERYFLNHRRDMPIKGAIVSGEMCMGYLGTHTSQAFQHLDEHYVLLNGLTELNGFYGATLLVNDACAKGPGMMGIPMRRIDRLSLHIVKNLAALHDDDDESSEDATAGASGMELEQQQQQQSVLQLPNKSSFLNNVQDVYEVVVRDFTAAPTAQLDSTDTAAAAAASLPPVTSRLSDACRDAVKRFDSAMDILLTMQNNSSLLRYCTSREAARDGVAAKVCRWARFVGATNQHSGTLLPRLLTRLGLQHHPCERRCGGGAFTVAPRFEEDEAQRFLKMHSQRRSDKQQTLRPPRSYRRQTDAVAGRANAPPVIEQVIGQESFSVDFHDRKMTGSPRSPQQQRQKRGSVSLEGNANDVELSEF